MKLNKRTAFITSLFVALCSGTALLAQSTIPTTGQSEASGPLRIHITAFQGGVQYRPSPDTRWQTPAVGMELAEGVELRTGPKGVIQFSVGTDQVYRVDRLTSVKVLRAALLPDGTIKTDVGMTYGRVSKDVDSASHPHQDTIVSPSSTLAVRGTRVSLYDQPPYAPEAVSLTGAAVFQNLHGQLIALGAKGEGTAKVNGDSTDAAQYQEQSTTINPQGTFAGETPAQQHLLTVLAGTGLQGTNLGVFSNIQALIASQNFSNTAIIGSLPIPGALQFPMFWSTNLSINSIVDFSVRNPQGQTFSVGKPPNPGIADGSRVAIQGYGGQEIDFGTPIRTGTYTITETLASQTISQNPGVQVTTGTGVLEANKKGKFTGSLAATGVVLNASTPTVTFTATVPINTFGTLPHK